MTGHADLRHSGLTAYGEIRRSRRLSLVGTVAFHLAVLLLFLLWQSSGSIPAVEQSLAVFDIALPPPEPPPPPVAPRPAPDEGRMKGAAKGGNAPRPALAPVARVSLTRDRPVPDVTIDAVAPPPIALPNVQEAAVGLGALIPASGAGSGGVGAGSGTGAGDGKGRGAGPGGGVSAPQRTTWIHYPTPEETRHYWPIRALRARITGRVFLSCRVPRPGPPKRCIIASETPTGEGFGRAALSMSRTFLIRPVTRDAVTMDLPIIVPVLFDAPRLPKP